MGTREESTSHGAVLIADDHEVIRFGLRQLLRDELGATGVLEADQFETALGCLDDEELGLAIIDLGMPGLSNPQQLREIREARPDVRVVVLSASEMRDDILGCLAAGVHGYIIKTEGLDELVGRLCHVLRGEIYVPPSLADLESSSASEAPSGHAPFRPAKARAV